MLQSKFAFRSVLHTFQSSPAPRYGCCFSSGADHEKTTRFNPHPHRGTGAASSSGGGLVLLHVSILTRTEVRVLHLHNIDKRLTRIVSILTRTEVRVLRQLLMIRNLDPVFQSSPAPRYGCCHGNALGGCLLQVSILTRTEVRVLPHLFEHHHHHERFQSSPAPRYGCCQGTRTSWDMDDSFNPHPHRGTGAATPLAADSWRNVSFNPHPHRGTGAATHINLFGVIVMFQSSPAPRYGCCLPRRTKPRSCFCFNPHPHRGTGAALLPTINTR